MPRGIPRTPEPREWVLQKRCAGCGETKAWAHFAPNKFWPDGSVRVVEARCHVCDRARKRERRYPPRDLEQRRAYARRWSKERSAALKADRAGLGALVSVTPIRSLLESLMADGTFEEYAVLAEAAGVSDRTVRRIFSEQTKTSLHIADTICTRLGVPLSDLYPEEVAA